MLAVDINYVIVLELTACLRSRVYTVSLDVQLSAQCIATCHCSSAFLTAQQCLKSALLPERSGEEQSQHYLQGRAKKPHVHTGAMHMALEESSSRGELAEGVCKRCTPVLCKCVIDFNKQTHRGSARRQHINPALRKPDTQHYWYFKKQNEWLRENMFDALGLLLSVYLQCIWNFYSASSTPAECASISASH